MTPPDYEDLINKAFAQAVPNNPLLSKKATPVEKLELLVIHAQFGNDLLASVSEMQTDRLERALKIYRRVDEQDNP